MKKTLVLLSLLIAIPASAQYDVGWGSSRDIPAGYRYFSAVPEPDTPPADNTVEYGCDIAGTTELCVKDENGVVSQLTSSSGTAPIEVGTATGQMYYYDNSTGTVRHTELSEILWDDVNKFLGIGNATPEVGLHVGSGTSTRGLTSADDAIVTGKVEVQGASFFEGLATYGDGLTFEGGSLHTWAGGYREVRGIDDGQRLGLNNTDGQGNNNLIITTSTNLNKDHDHDTLEPHPTIQLHDSTDPDVDNTRSLKLTYGLIEAMSGDLTLQSPAEVIVKEKLNVETDVAAVVEIQRWTADDGGAVAQLWKTNTDDGYMFFQDGVGGVNTLIHSNADSYFNGGDLGVGITTPSEKLHVSGGNARFDQRVLKAKGADVASAAVIVLGNGNYFDITGTTQIDTISSANWTAGSTIILQFDASVTVKHNTAGAGASILLAGAADFAATADDTLMLVYDGTTWREVSRTVI